MKNDYAGKMLETIKHLEQSDEYLQELLRNQILTIDSTAKIIGEFHKTAEKRVNTLEE